MANVIECDSCGTRIGDEPGELPLGMTGNCEGSYGIPAGPFNWCRGCTGIACKAVYAARPSDAQAEADKIRDMMAEAKEHPGRVITR
jgi:hypothetical protein